MGAESDSEVIVRTLSGDRRAFEILILRHGRMAYAVAFAQLGNHQDAEDAVQESWIQAFTALHRLHDPAKFAPWLASIVRNISINAARNRWRRRALDDCPEPPKTDPRAGLEDADLRRALWTHVEALTPEQREVLTLYYHAGLSVDELATLTGVPRETVKKRLQRARTALSAQTLHTLFEPAERDEEQRRKRVVAALLLLPLPGKSELPRDPKNAAPPLLIAALRILSSTHRRAALGTAFATAVLLLWGSHSCRSVPRPGPGVGFQAPAAPRPAAPPTNRGPSKTASPGGKGLKG